MRKRFVKVVPVFALVWLFSLNLLLAACGSAAATPASTPVAATATAAPTSIATTPTATTVPATPTPAVSNKLNLRYSTPSTINGAPNRISLASLSPDGKTIVTYSADMLIHFWEANTGNELLQIKISSQDSIQKMLFSLDSKTLLTHNSGSIKMWNVQTGKLLKELRLEAPYISKFAFNPNGKILWGIESDSEGANPKFKMWDFDSGNLIRTIDLPSKKVEEYSVSPFDIFFSASGKVTYSTFHQITTPTSTYLNEEYKVAINIWDLDSGKLQQTLDLGVVKFSSLIFSADGKYLLRCRYDKVKKEEVVSLWDVTSGKIIKEISRKVDFGNISFYWSQMHLSQDGNTLITRSYTSNPTNTVISVWDITKGQLIKNLQYEDEEITLYAASQDAKILIKGKKDYPNVDIIDVASELRLLSINSKTFVRDQNPYIKTIALTPDAKLFFSAPNTLREAGTGKELLQIKGVDDIIEQLAFSSDGKKLAILTISRTLTIWDVSNGNKLARVTDENLGDFKAVGELAFSSDDNSVIVIGLANFHLLLDIKSGKLLMKAKGGGEQTMLSADRKIFVCRSWENALQVWEVGTNKLLWGSGGRDPKDVKAFDSSDTITAVAISRDAKIVAAATKNNTLKLYDGERGKELLSLSGHTAWVNSLMFSKDGKTLLSGGSDSKIKLWDVTTGKELFSVEAFGVNSMALSSDGKVLVTGHNDGSVKVWDLS